MQCDGHFHEGVEIKMQQKDIITTGNWLQIYKCCYDALNKY